ncbi:SCO family protein [Calidifontibacillus oryziterrae]|uniref:SCO family protein n=1 Tax=Calidifontibacillus oryziterrae TaxID=1191699 RepID=UPI0003169B06|nr:SCO family protein [Calidifontibacillus oryziterrae]
MIKKLKLSGIIFIAIVIFSLPACGQEAPNSLGYQVEPFQFVNQNGTSLSTEDFKGNIWLADFIFTNCDDICPPMTSNMAKLQKRLGEEGISIPIVSFSVDPNLDTPETFKAYGEQYGADFETWNFVTGYTQAEIEQFALNSFKTLVQVPEDSDQVIHGSYFYLVDENGIVVKSYDGVNLPPLDEFVNDIKALQKAMQK